MEFNMNVDVEVKLTTYGMEVWEDYYKNLGLTPKNYKFHFKKNTKNILKGPLWEIMHIFGKCMYMGTPELPFEDNRIKILKG